MAARKGLRTRKCNEAIRLRAEVERALRLTPRHPKPLPPERLPPIAPEHRLRFAQLFVDAMAKKPDMATDDIAQQLVEGGFTAEHIHAGLASLAGPPPLALLAWVAKHFPR